MKYIDQMSQSVAGEYEHQVQVVRGAVRNNYHNPARKGEAEAAMSKFGQFLDEFTEGMLKPHIKVCKMLKEDNKSYVLPILNMVNYYKRKGIREALKKFHPNIFEKKAPMPFGKIDPGGLSYEGLPIGRNAELAAAVSALDSGTSEEAVLNHLTKHGWDAYAVFEGFYDKYIIDRIGEKYVRMLENYAIKQGKRLKKFDGPMPMPSKEGVAPDSVGAPSVGTVTQVSTRATTIYSSNPSAANEDLQKSMYDRAQEIVDRPAKKMVRPNPFGTWGLKK